MLHYTVTEDVFEILAVGQCVIVHSNDVIYFFLVKNNDIIILIISAFSINFFKAKKLFILQGSP